MALPYPTEEERQALCEWLSANGITPGNVPIESTFTIVESSEGRRLIHYTKVVRDERTGNIMAGEDGYPVTRDASAPCLVDPPPWLNIPRARQEPSAPK
jgi:hypothetical protein